MAKKTELKLEDFFTNTINSNGSKMPLQKNGEETEHYLVVSSMDSKEAARERINARAALSMIDEHLSDMEDGELKTYELNRLVDDAYKPLAVSLVREWSFGDLTDEKLQLILDENTGLSFSVIAHASEESNLHAKK